MSAAVWIAVALAGGVGAVARVGLEAALRLPLSARLEPALAGPAGTFLVNVGGAFALGLLDGLALSRTASTIVATALLGAYTTFSTWMVQTDTLLGARRRAAAVLLVLVSLGVGFGAVALGHALAG